VSADACVTSRDSKYRSGKWKEFNVDISVNEVVSLYLAGNRRVLWSNDVD